MADTRIEIGAHSKIGADAQRVRDAVFCVEQRISKELERDSYDAAATHAVLYENDVPVSVGRIIHKENAYFIGRVSTLKTYRGKGYGSRIVKALVDWAFAHDISEVQLHSQKHAEDFYSKLGFQSYGAVFYEAGIEHISMVITREA